ncbi:MAG: hypothetical protein ABJA90_05375 [Ginsengibacter sp.]
MKRFLLIILLQHLALTTLHSQSFSVNDLVGLASIPAKNIDHFMSKNGFISSGNKWGADTIGTCFIQKAKKNKTTVIPERSVDLFMKDDSKYFCFHTNSLTEFLDGQKFLIKKGFIYDTKKEIIKEPSLLFQKWNNTVQAIREIKNGREEYSFILRERKIPSEIVFAEDLLKFDSHEFLVSFFGEENVKKDLYYFSEKELKKCSVLFGNSSHQVVFVWDDENNLNNLAFILVSNIIPTVNSPKREGVISNNEWKLKCGMHPGMSVKDLIALNENDFEIYGNQSELGLMIKPGTNGKIDFKKTAVMLSCKSCNTDKFLQKLEVSALDVAKQNLPMYVFDIIIYPTAN